MKTRWLVWGTLGALLSMGVVAACSSDDGGGGPGVVPPSSGDGGGDVSVDQESDGAAPVTADLQFLDISDWHGQLDSNTEASGSSYGGLGVLMAYFAKEKASNPNTIIVTGGDAFGATPAISTFANDDPAVKGLNLLGMNFDTFGNHNFDNGTANTKRLVELATYKYVSTNLDNVPAELGSSVVTPYAMTTVAGVKVAILGLTNPDAPQLLFPGRMATLTIKDPAQAANDAAKQARAAGASVVVAMVHEGATNTDPKAPPSGPLLDLAAQLQGIDVLFGDHTDHDVDTTANGMLVTENRSKGRGYMKIAIHVEKGVVTTKTATPVTALYIEQADLGKCDGGNCTCPTTACPAGDGGVPFTCNAGKCQRQLITPDPAAETLLKPYRDALAVKFDVTIGTIDQTFPRDGALERTQETAIGDLVADALLAKYKDQGAQIAFTNGGGIRSSLPSNYAPQDKTLRRPATGYAAGPPFDLVTGDPYSILPFGNLCVVRKVSGQVLHQVLEKSIASAPATTYGGFLQIAGFHFTYSPAAAAGSKVQTVALDDGTPIANDTTEYTVVTNDFTNAGGDGYAMLVETKPSSGRDVMADVVLEYIKAHTPITTPAKFGTRITAN